MGTALQTYKKPKTKKQRDLEDAENRIAEAEVAMFEDGFTIAIELERIKNGKLYDYDGADCKTWEAYCRSDRTAYSKRHSNRLILALKYRRALPNPGHGCPGWTERSVHPLTTLSSPIVAGHCAKAILEVCEKEDIELTASLVKEYVDRVKNTKKEQTAKAKQMAADLREATAAKALRKLESYTRKHLVFLQTRPKSFWLEADDESPKIAARVAKVVSELASVLRGA
jgi:hypothetical protein